MLGINGSELIILIVMALVVLGPDKLPEYTRMLTEWLRKMRDMAEDAKTQFKEETGTDFDEVDWRKYDPRQYDPRRIIREALREPAGGTPTSRAQELTGVSAEDMHGGLTRQDIADMDPRTLFRSPRGTGSTAAPAAAADAAPSTATATAAAPAAAPAPVGAPSAAGAPATAGAPAGVAPAAVLAGGAAAALMSSGRAEEVLAETAPAPALDTEPNPLDLLGLAPAPFDEDAT